MTQLLETINLSRTFGFGDNSVQALDNVSISIKAGEIFGIVGESGSGKSTLSRLIMALDRPTHGEVIFDGSRLFELQARKLRRLRRNFQMVFQDPYSSLDPRQKIARIISEPLHLEGNTPTEQAMRERIATSLEDVGLATADMERFPHEFSGGQRQRIAIARALITRPKLLIADEPTSALDVSVQAQILKLILNMRDLHGISVLLITHNIGIVDEICDRVAVMQAGKLVEQGTVRAVLDTPHANYTKRLLAAEPTLESTPKRH